MHCSMPMHQRTLAKRICRHKLSTEEERFAAVKLVYQECTPLAADYAGLGVRDVLAQWREAQLETTAMPRNWPAVGVVTGFG